MTQIPQGFFIAVGAMMVLNFGAIITLLTFIFKSGVFVAKTEAGIKDATERANRAHKRISEHEKEMHQ